MAIKPLSVSQINSYIKRILMTDPILGNVTVTGEISNLILHSSGHCYFALKDDRSRLSCFLASDRVQRLRYTISDGMQVVVSGGLSVYEKGGTYSLNIRELDPVGEGALNLAFENLKKKLQEEGLFDPSRKKPLPPYPARIAVVTSPTGAAVRDIISTIKRRNPLVDIRIYPCLVQGPEAAESIVRALQSANAHKKDIDLILLGRGGGSTEDLWPFNEEAVARAVADSKIPIVSAVGHERDAVISDFVADLRAATPTAAAEHAVQDLSVAIGSLERMAPEALYRTLFARLEKNTDRLLRLGEIADVRMGTVLDRADRQLEFLALKLRMSNPLNVIRRGYSVVQSEKGAWILRASDLSVGDRLMLLMKDGIVRCTVEEVKTGS
ncbi:MAG: exodeoxyribonuclease VII large subunit [Bacillota bacterium]|nr:exodeoxyribonuclease VII large subunit [Bacillota bacterium]